MKVSYGYLRVQLVFEGSSVYLLNLPKSGGKLEAIATAQIRTIISQAPRMLKRRLTKIEYEITTARSTDMAETVSTLAIPVLTDMKPKLWHTANRWDGRGISIRYHDDWEEMKHKLTLTMGLPNSYSRILVDWVMLQ